MLSSKVKEWSGWRRLSFVLLLLPYRAVTDLTVHPAHASINYHTDLNFPAERVEFINRDARDDTVHQPISRLRRALRLQT